MLPEARVHQLQRVARELEADLVIAKGLQERIEVWQSANSSNHPDEFMLRAAGSLLHDFYNVIETAFERIAHEINGGVPATPDWHARLIEDMTLDLPGIRPAVISPETREIFDELRRFRHRFRHLYGTDLRWDRIEPLLGMSGRALESFRECCENVVRYLRSLAEGAQPYQREAPF